jgi:hypothetical protein
MGPHHALRQADHGLLRSPIAARGAADTDGTDANEGAEVTVGFPSQDNAVIEQ